jgi:hypothetical protein
MSELVYTMFGYGRLDSSAQLKPADSEISKELSAEKSEDGSKLATEDKKVQNTQETIPERIVKVTFKWGSIGYLPVVK